MRGEKQRVHALARFFCTFYQNRSSTRASFLSRVFFSHSFHLISARELYSVARFSRSSAGRGQMTNFQVRRARIHASLARASRLQ